MPMSSGGRVASSSDCAIRPKAQEIGLTGAAPCQPHALRSLGTMSWQRLNIGSRVTREGHARFWERPEVKFLGATRQSRNQWQAAPAGSVANDLQALLPGLE